MPDVEENKQELVDIDTSGPDVDVELAEPKEEKVEVENENVKDDNKSDDTPEKLDVKSDVRDGKDDKEQVKEEPKKEEELEQYSEGVQKRIAKLTKKWREAERQREAALEYAKGVQDEHSKLKTKVSNLEPSYVNAMEGRVVSGLQAAPDPRAEEWAEKNSWFGQDSAMTYTAFDLHEKLTKEEGFDPATDEYYAEVDKRMRLDFPHKFGNTEPKETTKPTQTVASATRSVKPGRNTVRLTSSQVAIAKKLGVPLEEYAKQLKITKEA